jgi:hypothetical protein
LSGKQNLFNALLKTEKETNKVKGNNLERERNSDHCQLAEIGWRASIKFLLLFDQPV